MHNWPLQRSFNTAYWFQGHSSDYFRPSDMFDGNSEIEIRPSGDYYLTDDLTDRACGGRTILNSAGIYQTCALARALGACIKCGCRGCEFDRGK